MMTITLSTLHICESRVYSVVRSQSMQRAAQQVVRIASSPLHPSVSVGSHLPVCVPFIRRFRVMGSVSETPAVASACGVVIMLQRSP